MDDHYNRLVEAAHLRMDKIERHIKHRYQAPTVPQYDLQAPAAPAIHLFVTNEDPVYTTPDSTTWSSAGTTVSNGADGVIYAPQLSLFIAGCRDARIQTSPDGVTWTQQAVPDTFRCSYLATDGTTIVCTGRNASLTTRMIYSTDAISWSLATDPHFSGFGSYIKWNGSEFMMSGDNYLTSPDGTTWTEVHDFSGSSFGYDVVYAGSLGLWITGGFPDGSNHVIATSSDGGSTWTGRSTPFDSGLVQAIAWNGSLLVAVGYDSSFNTNIMTSSDGVTWTARSTSVDRAGAAFGSAVIWDSNLSLWFAAFNGQNGSAGGGSGFYNIVTSSDGITWTAVFNTGNIPDYFAYS